MARELIGIAIVDGDHLSVMDFTGKFAVPHSVGFKAFGEELKGGGEPLGDTDRDRERRSLRVHAAS